MKTCNKCGKQHNRKARFCSHTCMHKAYKESMHGLTKDLYQRVKHNKISEIDYEIDDFISVLNNSCLPDLFNTWVKSGYAYNLKPTVTRDDLTKGFELDNLKFCTRLKKEGVPIMQYVKRKEDVVIGLSKEASLFIGQVNTN